MKHEKLPQSTPQDIDFEFKEAELCAAVGANRAASALFRSVLEKVLKANGFTKGNLQDKIDESSNNGVLTESRRRRAHENIRVLGNDVLHDAWREVSDDDVVSAGHYAQRILEDFYDDRSSVEKILTSKNRLANETKTGKP